MSTAVNIKQHTARIGNNDYIMVSGRVLLAHEDNPEALSIRTELVQDTEDYVTMKATIITRKGTFDGHATSYKRTGTTFEKKTPLEVSETSAVGRALGLAGYAIENGIASADEIDKAENYGNGNDNAVSAPPNNVRPIQRNVEPQQAEQQQQREDPRPALAQHIGDHLRELGLSKEQGSKLVAGLGPVGKLPKSYPVADWDRIWNLIRPTKTADEALGLAVKAAIAESKNTDEDLFPDPVEAQINQPLTQRQEDAENAKTYTNTKPLIGQITDKQKNMVQAITRSEGHEAAMEAYGIGLSELSKGQASSLIEKLKAEE